MPEAEQAKLHNHRPPNATMPPASRSKVGNRSRLLDGVDGRSATARRYRDLVHDFAAPLGGTSGLTAVELGLVRQGAMLSLRAEQLQAQIARREPVDDDVMLRLSSELRRVRASLRKRERPANRPSSLKDYVKAATARVATGGGGT